MQRDWKQEPQLQLFMEERGRSFSQCMFGENQLLLENVSKPDAKQFFEQIVNLENNEKIIANCIMEENSTDFLDEKAIISLNQSRDKQNMFIESLGQLRNGIIQHQIVNHISHQREKFQRVNYKMVQEYTKTRIDKMVKNKKIRKNWSNKDLKILVWIIAKFCEKNKIKDIYSGIKKHHWQEISSVIPGTVSEICMFKWLALKKSRVREEKWQEDQENLLVDLVQKHGTNWGLISHQLFCENSDQNKVFRCGKQCREHWNSFLNPKNRKGNWTKQEDKRLISLILNFQGKKKWTKILSQFQGRTENALKNRYTNLIQKEKKQMNKGSKKVEETILLKSYLERHNDTEVKEELSYESQQEFDDLRLALKISQREVQEKEKAVNLSQMDEIESNVKIGQILTVNLSSVDQIKNLDNLYLARQSKDMLYIESKANSGNGYLNLKKNGSEHE